MVKVRACHQTKKFQASDTSQEQRTSTTSKGPVPSCVTISLADAAIKESWEDWGSGRLLEARFIDKAGSAVEGKYCVVGGDVPKAV